MWFPVALLLLFCVGEVAYGQGQYVDLAIPACQTCCCGVLTGSKENPLADIKMKCCGTIRYNVKEDSCCQGQITAGIPEGYSRCCGNKAYDIRYNSCCKNTIVPASSTQDQCCFKTAYNQRREICCGHFENAKVYKRGLETTCCGNKAFSARFSICCREQLFPYSGWTHRCCGTTPYSPREQNCVDAANDLLIDSPRLLMGQDSVQLCYTTEWNPISQTCCDDVVHEGAVAPYTACCGKLMYDMRNALCCQGNLYFRNPKIWECCGDNVYDIWTQTCCGGQRFNQRGVCCGPNAVINPMKEICCHEEVVFTGCPTRTKCCFKGDGSVAKYDTLTMLCCDGVVQPGGYGYDCCGQVSYNLKFFSCCNGQLVSRGLFRSSKICTV